MGQITKLREIIGVIKDKVSQSKATITSSPNTLSLHLAVLRATTHSPSTPLDTRRLAALLSLGESSRATASASALIESLMDRLHRTKNSSVALKCLLTIHHIIKNGPFILQDQLSVFPAAGGRNYLKLSSFRDGTTAVTWVLSGWVRWYARYLETLLSTSRVLGFVLCSSSCSMEREKQEEAISCMVNADLIKDVNSLVAVVEEICKVPDSLLVEGNKLLYEVMGLLGNDYLSAVNEILLRLGEFKERLSYLGFSDSVELVCILKRLEDCKERLTVNLFAVKRPKSSNESLWELVEDLKGKVGMVKLLRTNNKDGRELVRKDKGSESARFGDRVLKPSDSVRFSSTRFGLNNLKILQSVDSTATYLVD